MLESLTNPNIMEYQKISLEEQKQRGILGRLIGPIADYLHPTRNGRKYEEVLWDKVFNDPIMQEKIDTKVCFGEIRHPIDGQMEVDPEKVAICLAEKPKKDGKGHLIGVFDILNTPCGQILKTFLDYGSKIGISSRGEGDIYVNSDGEECVDPDTYECCGWDIVFIPGVKSARLESVTESLNTTTSLTESLNAVVNNAKESDKKIMQEAIAIATEKDEMLYKDNVDEYDTLNDDTIDIQQQQQENFSNADDIDEESDDSEVENVESDTIAELQEALNKNQELEQQIISLQEKLSVCYTKEANQEERIGKLSKSLQIATTQATQKLDLDKKISTLTENYNSSKTRLQESVKECKSLKESIAKLSKSNKKLVEDYSSIKTKLDETLRVVDGLNQQNKQLEEKYNNSKSEYSQKLSNNNKLVEKYKKVASTAVDKYISSQASKIGCSVNEIKRALPESYSFKDIDDACEEVRKYRVGMSKLPFNSQIMNENIQIKAKSTKSSNSLPTNSRGSVFDDDVDNSLLSLAGLNK